MSAQGFIVLWDDNQGMCIPMSWDADCEGAICCAGQRDPVAVFALRKDARRAINISAAFARLCKAQGKPENADFTSGRSNLRIVPLEGKKGSAK